MTRHAIRFTCIVTLVSCVNHDFNNNAPEVVVSVASIMCGKSPGNMEWLKNLLKLSETDFALRGDIYAIKIDGRTIFLHQPIIMSCLACVLYDCDGNKIDTSTVDHEKLRAGMKPANRIYSPFFE